MVVMPTVSLKFGVVFSAEIELARHDAILFRLKDGSFELHQLMQALFFHRSRTVSACTCVHDTIFRKVSTSCAH